MRSCAMPVAALYPKEGQSQTRSGSYCSHSSGAKTLQEKVMSREFKTYPFLAKRYEARLPELRRGVEQKRHPVAIVGGGPVGLTAALGLANHGIPSVLIEADDSVCYGSRAICISRRSLEIIDRLGAVDGFLKTGLPWTGGRSFYRDTEVLHRSEE